MTPTWIKIAIDLFEDEKILMINELDNADSIILVWLKLLCLAGKQNNSGVFQMSNGKPYTTKMLALTTRTPEETIKEAVNIFLDFGMLETIDNVIVLPNWSKYQNFNQIEERNEYMKDYMKKYRNKQREKINSKLNVNDNVNVNVNVNSKLNVNNENVNSKLNVNVLDKNRLDKNRLEEIRRDKEENIDRLYVNKIESITTNLSSAYGEYNNVLLTYQQYTYLVDNYFNADKIINELSKYIYTSGKKYTDHFVTCKLWIERDAEKNANKTPYYMTKEYIESDDADE